MRPEIAIVGLALCAALAGPSEAKAQVVALGASNTRGYDLPLQDAWPAKLEALLRQRGYNVAVSNEGINGDTSEGMLSRVGSAVPVGTRVVVLECCGNDNKDGRHQVADHDGDIRILGQGPQGEGSGGRLFGRAHTGREARRCGGRHRQAGWRVLVRMDAPRHTAGSHQYFQGRQPRRCRWPRHDRRAIAALRCPCAREKGLIRSRAEREVGRAETSLTGRQRRSRPISPRRRLQPPRASRV